MTEIIGLLLFLTLRLSVQNLVAMHLKAFSVLFTPSISLKAFSCLCTQNQTEPSSYSKVRNKGRVPNKRKGKFQFIQLANLLPKNLFNWS